MPHDDDLLVQRLNDEGRAFLVERHLAVLATLDRRGGVHAVPVGFTAVDGLVRIITTGTTQKVRNAERGGTATVCQVDGGRWLTVRGAVTILTAPEEVEAAERLYAARYRTPRPNPARVVVAIRPLEVLASRALLR